MPTCPNGHQSGSDDWCEVCGHRMAGAVPPPPPPPPGPGGGGYGFPPPGGPGGQPGGRPHLSAVPDAEPELCPQCRTPREGGAPFCEECRWNFLTNTATSYTPAAPRPPAGSGGPPSHFQQQAGPGPSFGGGDSYEYQGSRPSQVNRPAEPIPFGSEPSGRSGPGRPGGPGGPGGPSGFPGDPSRPGGPGAPGPSGPSGYPGGPGGSGPSGFPGDPSRPGGPGPSGPGGQQGFPGDPGRPGASGPSGFPSDPSRQGGPGSSGFPGDPSRPGGPGNPGPGGYGYPQPGSQQAPSGPPGSSGPGSPQGYGGHPTQPGPSGPGGPQGFPGDPSRPGGGPGGPPNFGADPSRPVPPPPGPTPPAGPGATSGAPQGFQAQGASAPPAFPQETNRPQPGGQSFGGGADDWVLSPPSSTAPGGGPGGPGGYGYPQPGSTQAPPAPPGPSFPQQPATWTATIGPDRDYFLAMMQRSGPEAAGLNLPAYSPEQQRTLTGNQVTIGRRRHSTGDTPDVDLSVPPEDPGVSHQHAVLVQQPDGSWAVVDQNSTNGTTVNGAEEPITPFVPVPLQDGDRVHVGAWTTITIRRG
ncbi:FHA domain-containing protein [Streptomyces canus]|uniref:FHA domain-containing protein n=1 Tax=Streptomyces canus TaxID=58343 RepID=UPI0027873EC1|nr:FHA domain-containing protein [Streptomyces canus]MDQ1070483.1 hypothetical protein [Streptomyces canus]